MATNQELHICTHCKHCSGRFDFYFRDMECKKNLKYTSFVNGRNFYISCHILNDNGHCPDFEEHWFYKLLRKFLPINRCSL